MRGRRRDVGRRHVHERGRRRDACTVADADKGDYKKISEITCTVTDTSDKSDYTSNDVVEAHYVLKTCGSAPQGKQFKASISAGKQFKSAMDDFAEDTVCGDPTGETDCATTCFEDTVKKYGGGV